jgi:hypothetical protein
VPTEAVSSEFMVSGPATASVSPAMIFFLPHFVEQNFKILLVFLADISIIVNVQFAW